MHFQNYYVATVTWLIEYLSIRKINLCLDCADTGKIKYRETKLLHKVDCFASCWTVRNAIFLNASYVGFKRINGYADVFEIQLPKLRNRVSGKRMHPHAPQTRVRKYVCQAIRSPVDAPRRYKWDSPWYIYTRFVQYHQENVAEGNLWKYEENNERTVAREIIWTFRLKLLTNILYVLYKIFRNFISTITTTVIILTKSVI